MSIRLTRVMMIAGIAAAYGAAQAQLWNQPTDMLGGYSSQNDTTGGNGNFATAYDNFTLGTTSNVTSVSWVGSYFNPPQQGVITAFTIQFYADASGIPGASVYTTTINGTANETSLGNDAAGSPAFSYSAAVNFQAAGGTQYWMSIVPDLGFPPQWGWESGTGGDGAAYQVFGGQGSALATDLAFTLDGSPVPEPATLAALGLGALALIRRRNRK